MKISYLITHVLINSLGPDVYVYICKSRCFSGSSINKPTAYNPSLIGHLWTDCDGSIELSGTAFHLYTDLTLPGADGLESYHVKITLCAHNW